MTVTSTIAYLIANKAYESNVGITSVIMTFPATMTIAFTLTMIWPKLLERHTMKVYALRFAATAIMFMCAVQLTLSSTVPAKAIRVDKTETTTVTHVIAHPKVHEKKVTIDLGKTALDVLTAQATITTKKSSYGILVESINGYVNGTDNKFWTYMVNGKGAPVGAGEYKVQNGDIIEWNLTSYE